MKRSTWLLATLALGAAAATACNIQPQPLPPEDGLMANDDEGPGKERESSGGQAPTGADPGSSTGGEGIDPGRFGSSAGDHGTSGGGDPNISTSGGGSGGSSMGGHTGGGSGTTGTMPPAGDGGDGGAGEGGDGGILLDGGTDGGQDAVTG